MKQMGIIGVVAIAVGVAVAAMVYAGQEERTSSGGMNQGRFRLFCGEYEDIIQAEGDLKDISKSVTGVFKIDTDTGKTWVFHGVTDRDAKYHRVWMPIKE